MDTATITVSFEIGAYNHRRYSKPWGAIVTFDGPKPQYNFDAAAYLGDDTGGRVIVQCRVGDIVARGQRDNRNPKYTENNWCIVEDGGKTRTVDKAEAYDHWTARQRGQG
ncbi:MAG: hypothetical protein LBQ10_01220 [Desulfovibrio sp.]|nr:hypothetical protein [Desulfovibrio sp.]